MNINSFKLDTSLYHSPEMISGMLDFIDKDPDFIVEPFLQEDEENCLLKFSEEISPRSSKSFKLVEENESSNCTQNKLGEKNIRENDSSTEEIKSEKSLCNINNIASSLAQLQFNINLECSNKISKCIQEPGEPTVNLYYQGHKNWKDKGRYSECPEVLNKNILRSLKRYLKEQYKSQKSSIGPSPKSLIPTKRNLIKRFYNESIKKHSQIAQTISEKDELGVLHMMATLLQENVAFRKDTGKHRTLKKNMSNLIKTYTRTLFYRISSMPDFKRFMLILKEAGIFAQMIEPYPILIRSKEVYKLKIDDLIQTSSQ